MIEDIIVITEFAQKNDPNGTHDEVIKDIENGIVTIEEVKDYYREVLKQWLEDSGGDKRIQGLLNRLGE